MGAVGVVDQQKGIPAVDFGRDPLNIGFPAEIVGAGEVNGFYFRIGIHGGGDLSGCDRSCKAHGGVVFREEPDWLPVQKDAGVDQGNVGVPNGKELPTPCFGGGDHGKDG